MITVNDISIEFSNMGLFDSETPWIHPTTTINTHELILVVNGEVHHGGMNRVVNAQKAFEVCAKPWFAGECRVEVQDTTCPWNTGVYEIAWGEGESHVKRVTGDADIVVNANSLSALVTGRLDLRELAMLDTVDLRKNENMLSALFSQKGSCIMDFF